MPELKGMRRASAEAVIVGLIIQGTLVISGVLLARQLGPQQRGYAALLVLWPIVISKLGELGLPNAVAYFVARDPGLFRHTLGLAISLAKAQVPLLVLCHAAVLTAFLLGKPPSVIGAAVTTIVLVPALMATDYGLAILQGQQRFRALNVLRLVNPAVLVPGLLLLGAAHRTSLVAVMIVIVVAFCASGAASLIAALAFHSTERSQLDPVSTRVLLRFGVHGFLGSTYLIETFRIDQLAIGLFLSPTALGLYVVGIAFTNLPAFISQSLAYIAYPGVAAESNRPQRRRIIWQFFWLSAAASAATVLVLEGSIAVLIPLFFGPQFSTSVGIARIALVGGLLLSARRILAETLRGAGLPVASTLAEATLLATLLPALLIGGHYWGAEGVAGAVAIAGAGSLLVLILFEAHAMKITEDASVRTGTS